VNRLLNGKDIESEMIIQGCAFDYPVFSQGKYALEEEEPKRAQRGMWKLENGWQRPWDYREVKRLHSKNLKNVS
jgi:endonuclease YncB( thermonuclease family)